MITVGNAIWAEMTRRSDHAIINPKFNDNNDGSQTEYVVGTKGEYWACNTTGNWVVTFIPFKVASNVNTYKPVILNVRGNVEGRFVSQPKGILWHSTRSGNANNNESAEFYGTVNYVRDGADGLGWHATVGPNLLAVHMLAAEWAYNAREHSDDYIAIEVAQSLLDKPISAGSIKAAAYFVKVYVKPVWPDMFQSLNQAHHSQTAAGIRDGKSDIYRRNDVLAINSWNKEFLETLEGL